MSIDARAGWGGWIVGIGMALVAATAAPACDEGGAGGAGGSGAGGSGAACPIESADCVDCEADYCSHQCTDAACAADWDEVVACLCAAQLSGGDPGDLVDCTAPFEAEHQGMPITVCLRTACEEACGL